MADDSINLAFVCSTRGISFAFRRLVMLAGLYYGLVPRVYTSVVLVN